MTPVDSSRYGRGEPVEEPAVIKYIENQELNERRYVHPGCNSWIVPLDDSKAPETWECPRCHQVLPTEREQ